ncbi:TolC family protein [Maricaulis parjimensis]|uniref:TolC family protein n=1 Tax=Maricaulis parjimensis TaxID=144023 RepID=UPI001939D77B|nr:TolC family protein [Maricaulis parjimensis]
MIAIRRLSCLALPLVLVACASVDPLAERASLDADISARHAMPASPAVLPAPGEVLDRETAVAYALANNRGLAADLAEAGLARADWVQASRPENPVLGVVWQPHSDEPDFYDVDLMASVLGIVATPWRARAARVRYDAARDRAVLQAIDFAADVRLAWVDAVAARQLAELQAVIAEAAEASRLVAEEIHEAGNSARLDLVRETIFAERAAMAARTAQLEAEQARLSLLGVMGLPPETELELPDRLPEPDTRVSAPDLAQARELSLPLAAMRAEVDAAAREAGLEDAASLLEHAELGYVAEREDGDWIEGASVETALPLFDWGGARRAAARIRAQQAADRHAQMVIDIQTSIRQAELARDGALTELETLQSRVLPNTEAMLSESLRHYNAMQIGVFELMAAFEMRTQAGQDLVNALAQASRAGIRLEQIRAGGSPAVMEMGMAAPSMAPGEEGGH